MKWLTANVAVWLMISGIAAFVLVYMLAGQNASIEIASGMLLGSCVVVAITWSREAIGSAFGALPGGPQVLALGIFSMGFFGMIRQTWTQFYRYLDRPEWMLNHWTYPFILWCLFWSVIIVIFAPGVTPGRIPTSNKIQMMIAIFIGGLVAGVAITMSLTQLSAV